MKTLITISPFLVVVGFILIFGDNNNGAQQTKAEYTINTDQTHVHIKEESTGKMFHVKHSELNNYFIYLNQ